MSKLIVNIRNKKENHRNEFSMILPYVQNTLLMGVVETQNNM